MLKKTEEEKAEERADRLLRSHLSEEEWECWDERGVLYVEGSDGTRYMVRPGSFRRAADGPYPSNPFLYRDPVSGGSCVTPIDSRGPLADYILAIKLWVEADVEGFMQHLWYKPDHDPF